MGVDVREGRATAPPMLTPRLGLGQRLSYLGCSVGIGVFSAFNNFTLTLWLATFTNSYIVLGLLGNTRTFEGAIVSPVRGPGPMPSGSAGWAAADRSSW